MEYEKLPLASWPLSLSPEISISDLQQIQLDVDRLAAAAQYGWGHTIDFGPFRKNGILGRNFLRIAGGLDCWGWWPANLQGMRIADVGCFTGGLSLLMAHRGASTVYGIDEVPAHLDQCSYVARIFGMHAVRPVLQSAYRLGENIEPKSLDLIVLAGVLYHMSDMLVGLYALRELLKPGGTLLIQTSGVDDFQHSYANFGRFVAGRWWQPTGLCILDMLDFMGYIDSEVRFYGPNVCLARAVRSNDDIAYKRGLNWQFTDLRDQKSRSMLKDKLAPAPHIEHK